MATYVLAAARGLNPAKMVVVVGHRAELVRESLAEREVLLHMAAHLVTPLRFILPHSAELRPAWMLRVGLWIYDHLGGGSSLPASEALNLTQHGDVLKAEYRRAFAYSDCWVDDARLVVANMVSAQEKGARILTRTECLRLDSGAGGWRAQLSDGTCVEAKVIVNAAGPWVGQVLRTALGDGARNAVRLVRGSHIVVPRLHAHDHAYLLQNYDRRVVFLLPFERQFTLIGTTDVPVEEATPPPRATAAEVEYLCAAASRYVTRPVTPSDVVWTYSGVRALYDDGKDNPSQTTRDYVLQLDRAAGGAPILSVFGGKVTTYRKLAVHALDKLRPLLPGLGREWTQHAPLPGSDFGTESGAALRQRLRKAFEFISPDCVDALVARHGTRAVDILRDVRSESDLGPQFGAALTAREVDYFMQHEWACDADDVLWRRSKAGLHLNAAERAAVQDYINHQMLIRRADSAEC